MLSNLIQPGDFACIPVSGEGGKLIWLGETLNGTGFAQYQHAEVYLGTVSSSMLAEYPGVRSMPTPPPTQHGYMFGAYPGGARLTALSCAPDELPGALWSSGAFDLTPLQRGQIVSSALRHRGIGYSSLDYFALVLHHFGVKASQLEEYIGSSGHEICSQEVDDLYLDAGYHLFDDDRWPGYVTPADLAGLVHERLEGGGVSGTRML